MTLVKRAFGLPLALLVALSMVSLGSAFAQGTADQAASSPDKVVVKKGAKHKKKKKKGHHKKAAAEPTGDANPGTP